MYFLSILFSCTPKHTYTYPVEMNPQSKIDYSNDSESTNNQEITSSSLPFPPTTTPSEALQDNTEWFGNISLIHAMTQEEQNLFKAQWTEQPDLTTKYVMLKIQRAQTLSWAELAALPPTIQFVSDHPKLPFSHISLYNYKNKTWEYFEVPDDTILTLNNIHFYLEDHMYVLFHMNADNKNFIQHVTLGESEIRSAGSIQDPNFSSYPVLTNLERFELDSLQELPVEYSMESFCSPIGDQGLVPADTAFAVIQGAVHCQIGLLDHYNQTTASSSKAPNLLDFYILSGMQNGKYAKKQCTTGRTWSDIIPQYNSVDNNGIFESTFGTPWKQNENWNHEDFTTFCQNRISLLFPSAQENDGTSTTTSNTPTNLYGLTFKNILVLPNDMMIYRKLLVKGNPIVITIPIKDLEIQDDFRASYLNFPQKAQDLHSLVIVGFSDQKQAFRIRNSWGTDFADQGYFWLSYKMTRDLMEKNLFQGILFPLDKVNDVIVLGGDEDTGEDRPTIATNFQWNPEQTHILHNYTSNVIVNSKTFSPDENGIVHIPKEDLDYLTKIQKENNVQYWFVPELLQKPNLYFHFRSDIYKSASLDFTLLTQAITTFPDKISNITITGHQDSTSYENPTTNEDQKSLSELRINATIPLIKSSININKNPQGTTNIPVKQGGIEAQNQNRFVSLQVEWTEPIVEMDEATFQKLVQSSKTQTKNLSSQIQTQKLADWRGLSKIEVHQQLQLYGINPKDHSWYLDEKSPNYLPPEHPARIKYRKWYTEWSK